MLNDYKSNEFMLTTVDNPFDPFEQFASWLLFDNEKGYNTCGKLARIAQFSDDMTQNEIEIETNRAIDEIIANDFLNLYAKAYKKDKETAQTGTEPEQTHT